MPTAIPFETRELELMDRAIGALFTAAPAQRLAAVRHLFLDRLN